METLFAIRGLAAAAAVVPPSGGSLEIGNMKALLYICISLDSSPFGGIPRNWKLRPGEVILPKDMLVPPSGGSLEIGNN